MNWTASIWQLHFLWITSGSPRRSVCFARRKAAFCSMPTYRRFPISPFQSMPPAFSRIIRPGTIIFARRIFCGLNGNPIITFTGNSATQSGPRTGTITGDLTLRGITMPVILDVVWNKSGNYPFGDKHAAVGVSARTRFNRSDFDMSYAVANGWVGNEVEVIIEFEAVPRP